MTSSRRTPTDAEALAAALAEQAEEAARLEARADRGAGGGPGAGEEPGEEELLDSLEGRLSPEAEAALQRRLVASPEAARKLLDLADLVEARAAAGAGARGEAPPAPSADAHREPDAEAVSRRRPGEEPVDLAVRAGWRDLQRRLPSRGGARSRFPPLLSAIAATLLAAVIGLGVWVWKLEREDQRAFTVGSVRSLELGAASRSAEGELVELEPEESLRLAFYAEERCPRYRVEVSGPLPEGPGRAETHTQGGLERDGLGLVTPLLVRPAPGRYTVRLLGCEPERELSTHGFEIVRPGNATPR